jgi:hypothetical protein
MIGNTGFDSKDCDGIDCGDACSLIGNTAYGNGDNGIEADTGCTYQNNTGYNNLAAGIDSDGTSTLIGNSAWGNTVDVDLRGSGHRGWRSRLRPETTAELVVGDPCGIRRDFKDRRRKRPTDPILAGA